MKTQVGGFARCGANDHKLDSIGEYKGDERGANIKGPCNQKRKGQEVPADLPLSKIAIRDPSAGGGGVCEGTL